MRSSEGSACSSQATTGSIRSMVQDSSLRLVSNELQKASHLAPGSGPKLAEAGTV